MIAIILRYGRDGIPLNLGLNVSGYATFENINKAYGAGAISRLSVFKWYGRFRAGNEALGDENGHGTTTKRRKHVNLSDPPPSLDKEVNDEKMEEGESASDLLSKNDSTNQSDSSATEKGEDAELPPTLKAEVIKDMPPKLRAFSPIPAENQETIASALASLNNEVRVKTEEVEADPADMPPELVPMAPSTSTKTYSDMNLKYYAAPNRPPTFLAVATGRTRPMRGVRRLPLPPLKNESEKSSFRLVPVSHLRPASALHPRTVMVRVGAELGISKRVKEEEPEEGEGGEPQLFSTGENFIFLDQHHRSQFVLVSLKTVSPEKHAKTRAEIIFTAIELLQFFEPNFLRNLESSLPTDSESVTSRCRRLRRRETLTRKRSTPEEPLSLRK
ncbi:unnamed protein product [Cylicocyclus nassatus]|uniref:Mos1 transposase HTH domain-containing protein n=1 Tax=Cylicocyclus nassatus TaxID=53992 RepID=A0AA36GR31_CYLNA|nr:unnamed protein product [Cylicocyclus nassatus]